MRPPRPRRPLAQGAPAFGAAAAAGVVLATGCVGGFQSETGPRGTECVPPETRCRGSVHQVCGDGLWEDEQDCAGGVCDADQGCLQCIAGTLSCRGADVVECGEDGRFSDDPVERCAVGDGEACIAGRCENACAAAAASRSYIGCVYYPTVTLNSTLERQGFDFAVAVANPQPVSVAVEVARGGDEVAAETVAAGGVEVITLPWVAELVGAAGPTQRSALVRDGAYRLTSSMPVTVYQFNPLQFRRRGGSCPANPLDCSYTNDASLLLPANVLAGEYLGIARATFGAAQGGRVAVEAPGFLAVVGTGPDTTVSVTLTAHLAAGTGVSRGAPGDALEFTLGDGDVLQLASSGGDWECGPPNRSGAEPCVAGRDHDLTGTRITADRPVVLFGGHDCALVPFDRWFCDHLEEQVFPLETWGASAIAVSTEPQVDNEPNLFRVVSGSDGNHIEFDPRVRGPVTLDAGEYVEFEHQGGLRAAGTGRLALAQFMVGEDYNGPDAPPTRGDPSMGLAIPVEQFREAYEFLTPDSYEASYVTVIAPAGGGVQLDDRIVDRFSAIGDTGFGFARVQVQPGAHHVATPIDDMPFGITVSGIAPYTSYLYPGGLDLEAIPIE